MDEVEKAVRATEQEVDTVSQRQKRTGPAIAALIAASASILAIGILTFAAEASEPLKEFLAFWEGMGSLSGKIAIAYVLGIVVFLALFKLKSLDRQRLVPWTVVLVSSVALSSLFVFTPFIKLFVG